jgi:hypothetical protein
MGRAARVIRLFRPIRESDLVTTADQCAENGAGYQAWARLNSIRRPRS